MKRRQAAVLKSLADVWNPENNFPLLILPFYLVMLTCLELRWLKAARFVGNILEKCLGINCLVELARATIYSQLRDHALECKTLMRLLVDNPHDFEMITRAGLSAAYAGQVESLISIRDVAAQQNLSVQCYLDGLLAFLNKEPKYYVFFQKSVEYFQGLINRDLKGELPEYIKLAHNVGKWRVNDDLASEVGLAPKIYRELEFEITQSFRLENRGPVVLISCDECYLVTFADFFIKSFRLMNQDIIHFHVVTDDIDFARKYLHDLRNKYSNVYFSVEVLNGRSVTYITIVRYLICRDVMNFYARDVLISDIDMCLKFNTEVISQEITFKNYDFGLCDEGFSVPWAKFAAGLSYFRVDNVASNDLLEFLNAYLVKMYSDVGFWTMDQMGILVAFENLQFSNPKFLMLNLNELVDFNSLISVPRRLQRQKIVCKFQNGAPK